ncbi:hypothetical protein DFH11DRAFT_1484489, partial [Phellopilus nigrolimitatus]
LIKSWLVLEKQLCFPESKKTHRPDCIDYWQKRKKNYFAVPPFVLASLTRQWIKWWVSLQPEWRRGDSLPLSREMRDGEQWVETRKGGGNGIFLVVLSLSWWASALVDGSNREFDLALDDVCWV